MITDWTPERVVAEVRAAEAVGRAVDAVPGVVRRQPGLAGLVGQLLAEAWTNATGGALPDLGGITAARSGTGALALEVRIVVDGHHRVADVGAAAHAVAVRAAAGALPADVSLGSVRVLVVEVDLYDRG